jgi:HEPN domain-containing protein
MVLGVEEGLPAGRGLRDHVTNQRLGESYVERAQARLPFLRQMQAVGLHADVVRGCQEVVELALKGLLRMVGVDPPKEHDVSKYLVIHEERLPPSVRSHVQEIRHVSKRLRREGELAFYGDEDFVPSDEYDEADSTEAIGHAETVVGWVVSGVAELGA